MFASNYRCKSAGACESLACKRRGALWAKAPQCCPMRHNRGHTCTSEGSMEGQAQKAECPQSTPCGKMRRALLWGMRMATPNLDIMRSICFCAKSCIFHSPLQPQTSYDMSGECSRPPRLMETHDGQPNFVHDCGGNISKQILITHGADLRCIERSQHKVTLNACVPPDMPCHPWRDR